MNFTRLPEGDVQASRSPIRHAPMTSLSVQRSRERRDSEPLRSLLLCVALDQQADLMMDCIAEQMQQKVDLLRRLPLSIGRESIFITTTSGLSITEMARQSGAGNLLAGTHCWNPPHLMPLVEVIRGEDTPASVLDLVAGLVHSIGKIPVRVNRDVPGFIGNR